MKATGISFRIIAAASALLTWHTLAAQTPIVGPGYENKTLIAPAFFGPNTFQVPQMLDGTLKESLTAELAADYIYGRTGTKDDTFDIYLKVQTPLFSDRVNLSIWWTVHEWYDMSDDVLDFRRISSSKGKSHTPGTLFFSTDILLLKENRKLPGITLRAATRTAAEDGAYENARGYDAPGYFFDIAAGKQFGRLRLAASGGFLCWQTDYGRQNDAVMYGFQASYTDRLLSATAHYGGYWGWERLGDFPRTLRLRLDAAPASQLIVRPYIEYQHGFNDWPFDLFRIGLVILN